MDGVVPFLLAKYSLLCLATIIYINYLRDGIYPLSVVCDPYIKPTEQC
jgi:hypothetical protein